MTTYQQSFDFGDMAQDMEDQTGADISGILSKVSPSVPDASVMSDRIRRIVQAAEEPREEQGTVRAPAPAPNAAAPVARDSGSTAPRADDRWAELREAPPEPDDLADTRGPADETPGPALMDAEAEAPLPPETPEEQLADPADDLSVAAPSRVEAAAEPAPAPQPEPVAPLTRTDWDTPADHEMGRKGKMAWRIGVYGALLAIPTAVFALSPFPPKETAQHHVSALGCQFAALFGMTNIKEGEPGFHAHLDPDSDGVACEVKRQRLSMGGGAGFKRP